MKICNNCQAQLKDDARFCNLCGAPAAEKITTAENEDNVYSQLSKREIKFDESDFSVNKISVAENEAKENVAEIKEEVSAESSKGKEKEQKCLDELYKKQKWEVLAWTLTSIWPVLSSLMYAFLAFAFIAMGLVFMSEPAEVGTDFYSYNNGVYDYYGDFYGDYYGGYYGGYNQSQTAEDLATAGIVCITCGGTYVGMALVSLAKGIFFLVYGLNINKKRKKMYTDCTKAVAHSSSPLPLVIAAITNHIALAFVIVTYVCAGVNKETFEKIKEVQAEYNKR